MQEIKEKTADEIEWLFTFDFYEDDYYQDDCLHRIIKIYAKSKEEAINKLKLLVKKCNNLHWNCQEVRR